MPVSGATLPVVAIPHHDISQYQATMAERGKYLPVFTSFHDRGNTKTVTAGAGEAAFRLRHVHPTEESAVQAAQAKPCRATVSLAWQPTEDCR